MKIYMFEKRFGCRACIVHSVRFFIVTALYDNVLVTYDIMLLCSKCGLKSLSDTGMVTRRTNGP